MTSRDLLDDRMNVKSQSKDETSSETRSKEASRTIGFSVALSSGDVGKKDCDVRRGGDSHPRRSRAIPRYVVFLVMRFRSRVLVLARFRSQTK